MSKPNMPDEEKTIDDEKVSNYLSYIESGDTRIPSLAGGVMPIYGCIGPIWLPPLPPLPLLPLPLDGGLWPWCTWGGVATGPCSVNRDGWRYHDGEQIIPGHMLDSKAQLKCTEKYMIPDDFESACNTTFIFEYHQDFNNTEGYTDLTKSGKLGSYISGFLQIVNVHALAKLDDIEICLEPCHAKGTIIGHRFQHLDGTLETVTRVSVVCIK